jgi:hypothetical protein
MAKSLAKPVKPDRSRIDMADEAQVRHWTKKFGVDREKLQRAVEKVGPVIKTVAKELGHAA